jgi:hypothetical protein
VDVANATRTWSQAIGRASTAVAATGHPAITQLNELQFRLRGSPRLPGFFIGQQMADWPGLPVEVAGSDEHDVEINDTVINMNVAF